MPLVTDADFMAPAKTRPELKVYQLARMRVNDPAKPMPPGGNALPAADLALFNQWLDAGAIAGSPSDGACQTAPPATAPGDVGNGLVAEAGETCFSLQAHGAQTAGDTSPYTVHSGEYYHQFYYKSPWSTGAQGSRFGARFDNVQVLHHWLLFTTAKDVADGSHEDDSGSHIGDTAQLIAGWAVGGQNMIMPDDVGFELPASGSMLQLEWHYFNRTDGDQPDSTAVQICTVAQGTRPKLASITWLGTEDFNGPFGMPPGQTSQFGGTCTPSRAGMNATDPIHIFFVLPHMHLLGRHMTSVANRANGQQETVYDMPFDFNQQIHHAVSIDLMPGDTITSTCTFVNDTDHAVAFGPSTTQEMCYQFAFSYPAHALENGVFSLNGATNTCW